MIRGLIYALNKNKGEHVYNNKLKFQYSNVAKPKTYRDDKIHKHLLRFIINITKIKSTMEIHCHEANCKCLLPVLKKYLKQTEDELWLK